MAIEFCSENSNISPRISFSHDFSHSDVVPVEQHPLRSNSTGIDFDFCVRESFDQESSSADELFSDGKILPTEIKKKNPPLPLPAPRVVHGNSNSNENPSKSSKESKIIRDEAGDEAEEKQSSKSFWRFNRSSSLNCGSGYGRSLCPLPLLSRSNSTGSTPNDKRMPLSKDSHNHKQHSQKQPSFKSSQFSSSTSYHKPPLKKNYGSYASGVSVNPVLNVPSGNLFGFGSFFSNGKDKNKKK